MKWAKIFCPELILELWYLLLHPGLPSVSGGNIFGSTQNESWRWHHIWVNVLKNRTEMGINCWTRCSSRQKSGLCDFTLAISWGKTKKKGLVTLKYLFLALLLLLMTTWLHLRCLHAPELGRWCQQSMCDYRWPLDRWPPWRSCILLGPALFPAGGWRQKAAGITMTGIYWRHRPCPLRGYRSSSFRPSTTGPDLCPGSWDLQDPVLTGELLLSQVIMGNPNFQWNTIVPQCRMRGNVRLLPAAYTV